MKIDRLVSSNLESVVVDVQREPHLKLTFLGASHSAAMNNKYVNTKQSEIYIPLWALPYIMRNQRESIAKHEAKELEFLERIKKAFNTEIQSIK